MSGPAVPGAPYGGVPAPPDGQTAPVAGRRPVVVWDLVLTLILVLPMLATVVTTMFISPFLVMASDPCGAVRCDDGLLTAGILIAFLGPIVVLVVATVVMIILLVRRRIAFYVPLCAIALMIGVFFAGLLLVIQGVPGSTL